MTPDYDAAVVKVAYAEEEAYSMGFDRFDQSLPDIDSNEDKRMAVDHFQETAQYANVVAPRLRAISGFDDGGHGTYQMNREVAEVKPGCEEDEPAPARITDARTIFNEVVIDAWHRGANDALDGRDPDVERGSVL